MSSTIQQSPSMGNLLALFEAKHHPAEITSAPHPSLPAHRAWTATLSIPAGSDDKEEEKLPSTPVGGDEISVASSVKDKIRLFEDGSAFSGTSQSQSSLSNDGPTAATTRRARQQRRSSLGPGIYGGGGVPISSFRGSDVLDPKMMAGIHIDSDESNSSDEQEKPDCLPAQHSSSPSEPTLSIRPLAMERKLPYESSSLSSSKQGVVAAVEAAIGGTGVPGNHNKNNNELAMARRKFQRRASTGGLQGFGVTTDRVSAVCPSLASSTHKHNRASSKSSGHHQHSANSGAIDVPTGFVVVCDVHANQQNYSGHSQDNFHGKNHEQEDHDDLMLTGWDSPWDHGNHSKTSEDDYVIDGTSFQQKLRQFQQKEEEQSQSVGGPRPDGRATRRVSTGMTAIIIDSWEASHNSSPGSKNSSGSANRRNKLNPSLLSRNTTPWCNTSMEVDPLPKVQSLIKSTPKMAEFSRLPWKSEQLARDEEDHPNCFPRRGSTGMTFSLQEKSSQSSSLLKVKSDDPLSLVLEDNNSHDTPDQVTFNLPRRVRHKEKDHHRRHRSIPTQATTILQSPDDQQERPITGTAFMSQKISHPTNLKQDSPPVSLADPAHQHVNEEIPIEAYGYDVEYSYEDYYGYEDTEPVPVEDKDAVPTEIPEFSPATFPSSSNHPPKSPQMHNSSKTSRRASTGRVTFNDNCTVWEFTISHASRQSLSLPQSFQGFDNTNQDKAPTVPHRPRRPLRRYSTGSVNGRSDNDTDGSSMLHFWQYYEPLDKDCMPRKPRRRTFVRTVRFAPHVTVFVFPKNSQPNLALTQTLQPAKPASQNDKIPRAPVRPTLRNEDNKAHLDFAPRAPKRNFPCEGEACTIGQFLFQNEFDTHDDDDDASLDMLFTEIENRMKSNKDSLNESIRNLDFQTDGSFPIRSVRFSDQDQVLSCESPSQDMELPQMKKSFGAPKAAPNSLAAPTRCPSVESDASSEDASENDESAEENERVSLQYVSARRDSLESETTISLTGIDDSSTESIATADRSMDGPGSNHSSSKDNASVPSKLRVSEYRENNDLRNDIMESAKVDQAVLSVDDNDISSSKIELNKWAPLRLPGFHDSFESTNSNDFMVFEDEGVGNQQHKSQKNCDDRFIDKVMKTISMEIGASRFNDRFPEGVIPVEKVGPKRMVDTSDARIESPWAPILHDVDTMITSVVPHPESVQCDVWGIAALPETSWDHQHDPNKRRSGKARRRASVAV